MYKGVPMCKNNLVNQLPLTLTMCTVGAMVQLALLYAHTNTKRLGVQDEMYQGFVF